MYNKKDRAIENDRFRAIMNQIQKLDLEKEFEASCTKAMGMYRNEIAKMACKMAELKAKVDLYEKYISYCTDHDSVELGEVCSFNGELYRMVSREDKQGTDSAKTVCCEFICVTPITKDFKKSDKDCTEET